MKTGPAILLVLLLFLHPAISLAQWQPAGVVLSNVPTDQEHPEIVTDGAGGAIVAWLDLGSGTGPNVYVQRVNASGQIQWTANGVALSNTTIDEFAPVAIVSDGAGGAIVAWADRRSAYTNIYAQRVNESGEVQWTTNGVAICTGLFNKWLPKIASDGAGGAIVTWYDQRDMVNTDTDVYAQRISAAGVIQWTSDGVLLCNLGFDEGDQRFPEIVSDGVGGAIVTWEDARSLFFTDIYAQQINASGELQWGTDGSAISIAPGNQFKPKIIADGEGGAIVMWTDAGQGIYAQRVSPLGVGLWTGSPGGGLSVVMGAQDGPAMASDGIGGCIVTWGTGLDIRAQRVNALGALEWEVDGIDVSIVAGTQSNPSIAADGADGVIVTWEDRRSVPIHSIIYAQRIDTSGAAQWTANGVALSNAATSSQQAPKTISDGAGGAIVSWQDDSSQSDIYAQRVSFSGGIPTGVSGTPRLPAISVFPNHPNPFSDATELEIALPAASSIEIGVYDVTGRRVREQVLAQHPAGRGRVSFDGRDDAGRLLPSGVYFWRARANGTSVNRKIVIAR